jgi:hypothetical protein
MRCNNQKPVLEETWGLEEESKMEQMDKEKMMASEKDPKKLCFVDI